MKVFNTSFTLSSEEATEVTDITKLVREAIQQFPVSAGIALINTLHTTCAVFINEFQSALIDDLKGLVERLVPDFLWISTEHTAKLSLDGLERNKMRVVPGVTSKAMSVASGYAPRAIVAPIVGAFYKKLGDG